MQVFIKNEGNAGSNLADGTETKGKTRDIFSLFIPVKGYFITPILLDINILLFIILCLSGVNFFAPDKQSIINWGASLKTSTLNGQWWRLFIFSFLHVGIVNLVVNMFALVSIGTVLEPRLGRLKFLSGYILTGLGSGLTNLFWGNTWINTGAVGAILGMYGILTAMLTINLTNQFISKTLVASIIIFVCYNIFYAIKGDIDIACNIAGLITGLMIGYAFYPVLKKHKERKYSILTVSLLGWLMCIAGVTIYGNLSRKVSDRYNQSESSPNTYSNVEDNHSNQEDYIPYNLASDESNPDDLKTYRTKMKRFVILESMALEIYQSEGNNSRENTLNEIKTRSLYYWNENLEIIREASQLKLSGQLQTRNRKLLKYCELRIESLNLLYKATEENTTKYSSQIDALDSKINSLVDELKK